MKHGWSSGENIGTPQEKLKLMRKDICIRVHDLPTATTSSSTFAGSVVFPTNAIPIVKAYQVKSVNIFPAWKIVDGSGGTSSSLGSLIYLKSSTLAQLALQNGFFMLADSGYTTNIQSEAVIVNDIIGIVSKIPKIHTGDVPLQSNTNSSFENEYENPLVVCPQAYPLQRFDWRIEGWKPEQESIVLDPADAKGSIEIIITLHYNDK